MKRRPRNLWLWIALLTTIQLMSAQAQLPTVPVGCGTQCTTQALPPCVESFQCVLSSCQPKFQTKRHYVWSGGL
jgi:hypothetical protein